MKTEDYFGEYVANRIDSYLEDMRAFCRVPSVTSDEAAIAEMADLVQHRFERAGFQITRGQVAGAHPSFVVTMEGRSGRRLLFFNHYDVDAPGAPELWESPPFEPSIRNGKLLARGIADNKGSMLSRLHAVEALLAHEGELPCGVTFLIEAKKSMHAPHLGQFVNEHRDLLRADACLWENSTVSHDGRKPTFRLGDKGMLMVRIRARGTKFDLSSQYAPIFPSAAWKLVTMLARIRDEWGRVLLSGFYDDIEPLSPAEEELIRSMPLQVSDLERLAGLELGDDADLFVRYFADPTANLAMLTAGPKSGQEMMSVNPAEASALLDFRLVPNQDPVRVIASLQDLARELSDERGSVQVEVVGTMNPARTPIDHPFIDVLRRVAVEVYGEEPILEPMSPTVGSRSLLSWSAVPIVGYGISYSGSNIQAPNEHIRLDDYRRGVLFLSSLLRSF